MLELKAQGEKHPKTFVLVTDDAEGELDRINELFGEVGIQEGDADFDWFNGHSADEFREGVEIPGDFAMDFTELLENDWPHAYEVVERERAAAFRELEEKAEAESGD